MAVRRYQFGSFSLDPIERRQVVMVCRMVFLEVSF
jgi:hypothetical protein